MLQCSKDVLRLPDFTRNTICAMQHKDMISIRFPSGMRVHGRPGRAIRPGDVEQGRNILIDNAAGIRFPKSFCSLYVLQAHDWDENRSMTDDTQRTLHPVSAAEVEESLSFALRYAGRRRVHTADDVMARVTAERLVRHLERSGYVLMKRPAAAAPSTSPHRHPNGE